MNPPRPPIINYPVEGFDIPGLNGTVVFSKDFQHGMGFQEADRLDGRTV